MTATYTKLVSKGNLQFCYLRIRLDFETATEEAKLEAISFKRIVLESVKTLFGQTGACSLIDVLSYDPRNRTAVIKIHHNFLSRFWSSLTLYSSYNGRCCAFRVLQVSPHLMALASNSRTMPIPTVQIESRLEMI